MPLSDLQKYLPGSVAEEICAHADSVTEIRFRAGKPVQIVCTDASHFIPSVLSVREICDMAVRMMDHSYYAHEHELSQGFFTMANGCRVGVGGSFSEKEDGGLVLKSISSLCVRIARPVLDCAVPLVREMTNGNRLRNALVLSSPGMGKTTMLRDAARLLSDMGYTVGIADERGEIAACRNGIPSMDVGVTTDVIDGCTKARAMEYLTRSMAPQIIVTDEIGNQGDVSAIRDACRKGVALLASAHADSFEQFEAGSMAELFGEGLFSLAVLLAEKPGRITSIRKKGEVQC